MKLFLFFTALHRFATVDLKKAASCIDFHLVERTGVVERFGKCFVEVIHGKQKQAVDCEVSYGYKNCLGINVTVVAYI